MSLKQHATQLGIRLLGLALSLLCYKRRFISIFWQTLAVICPEAYLTKLAKSYPDLFKVRAEYGEESYVVEILGIRESRNERKAKPGELLRVSLYQHFGDWNTDELNYACGLILGFPGNPTWVLLTKQERHHLLAIMYRDNAYKCVTREYPDAATAHSEFTIFPHLPESYLWSVAEFNRADLKPSRPDLSKFVNEHHEQDAGENREMSLEELEALMNS